MGLSVIGFCATSRFDARIPKFFVDECHQAGLGVILDWVPGLFEGRTRAGLVRRHGALRARHPRQGEHQDWGTLIQLQPQRVRNSSLFALFWLHNITDGLRATRSSMLYLDYSRTRRGQWPPNRFGGRENLDAIDFL